MTTLTHDRTSASEGAPVIGPVRRVGLVTGAVSLVAATMLLPATDATATSLIASATDHPTRTAIGGLLLLLGHVVIVPGVLGVAAAFRGLPAVAGAAAGLGAMVFGSLGMLKLVEVAVARSADPETGAAVLGEFESMPWVLGAILPAVVAVNLGLLVLVISLWRRGALAPWPIATVVLGVAGVMTGGDGTALGVVGSALLGASVVSLGFARSGDPDA